MKILNNLEMKIKAIGQNESFARSAVASFCVGLNPTLEEIADIKTAVSEAVTNCIVHGYEKDEEKEIFLSVKLFEDNSLEIIVKDFGLGIDNIDEAMQPFFTTKPQEERSGMGFALMSSFMDELTVESKKNVGTTVVMRKKIVVKEG